MHAFRTDGPLSRQLGWTNHRGDLDVVSPTVFRRQRDEREAAERKAAAERRRMEEAARLKREARAAAERIRQLFPVPPPPDAHWTTDDLKRLVCRTFGLSHTELIGQARHQYVVLPRHVAMWLCCRFSVSSRPQTAKRFGNRDHTTILHARNKMQELIDAHGIDGGDDPAEWARLLKEALA